MHLASNARVQSSCQPHHKRHHCRHHYRGTTTATTSTTITTSSTTTSTCTSTHVRPGNTSAVARGVRAQGKHAPPHPRGKAPTLSYHAPSYQGREERHQLRTGLGVAISRRTPGIAATWVHWHNHQWQGTEAVMHSVKMHTFVGNECRGTIKN